MKSISKIFFIILILIIVTLACTLLIKQLYINSKISQAIEKTTQIKKTPFTELYFENTENLPSKPTVIKNFNSVPYTFSFTIHNIEDADMTYLYLVQINGIENVILDSNSVSIKNGEKKTITETFLLPNKVDVKTKITVSLQNKNQSIAFWMGGQQ